MQTRDRRRLRKKPSLYCEQCVQVYHGIYRYTYSVSISMRKGLESLKESFSRFNHGSTLVAWFEPPRYGRLPIVQTEAANETRVRHRTHGNS